MALPDDNITAQQVDREMVAGEWRYRPKGKAKI